MVYLIGRLQEVVRLQELKPLHKNHILLLTLRVDRIEVKKHSLARYRRIRRIRAVWAHGSFLEKIKIDSWSQVLILRFDGH